MMLFQKKKQDPLDFHPIIEQILIDEKLEHRENNDFFYIRTTLVSLINHLPFIIHLYLTSVW